MKKDHLTLTENDRTTLEGLLAKGTLAVKTFKRARPRCSNSIAARPCVRWLKRSM
jgi:hypothetical protein